jgi:hypothetical protein
MDYLFQDGGKPKVKKSKTASKTTKSKTTTKTTKSKSSSKTGTKTTKSKTTSKKSSSKKGGNFLGSVGDLVAPTGWGPFATAAALVGLDRVDAALRRGKSEKSSAKKGGMRGGNDEAARRILQNDEHYEKEINGLISRAYQNGASNMTYPFLLAPYGKELYDLIEYREKLLPGIKDSKLQKQFSESIEKFRKKREKLGHLPNGTSRFKPLR